MCLSVYVPLNGLLLCNVWAKCLPICFTWVMSSHKIIGVLYVSWIKSIKRYCFANIFCQFVIFSSLTVSFEKQNFKFLSSPIYPCLFPLLFAYICPAINFFSTLSHWIFSYKFYSYIYCT